MAQLELHVLGGFEARLNGAPITTLATDKGRALLVYLVVEKQRAHRRESLAALLWPEVPESAARQSLSQALTTLRKALKDDDKHAPFLLTDRDTVRFNPQADVTIDSDDLDADGVFLDGFSIPDAEGFDEWLLMQRESTQRLRLERLERIIVDHLAAGRYVEAIAACHRQLSLDPWREETHQHLMTAYARNGQRSDALAQFDKCRAILRDSLGVEPGLATLRLYEQIQSDALTRAPLAELPTAPAPLTPRTQMLQLPTSLTPFVGRERELSDVLTLIADPQARLITVMGMGGIGKTRLAMQAAMQTAAHASALFEGGVAFVPLAALDSAQAVAAAIASAWGIGNYPPDELLTEVRRAARGPARLLILDNVEHLLAAGDDSDTVALIAELLLHAPQLKILVTSREALNLPGEWVLDLHGLGADGVSLFVQRAQRARVGFQPSEADTRAIERICRLVDGLPLGIELAASWMRVLDCADIAAEIERSIDFLSSATRQVSERHRSVTAVLEQTWRLLGNDERDALTKLSVFNGGFSREAASVVANASLPVLSALVNKSLVRWVGGTEGRRYELHALIRSFVAAHLPDRAAVLDAMAQYFERLIRTGGYVAQPAQHHLRFAELIREQANLENVCAHLLASGQGQRTAQLLGQALSLWLSGRSDAAFGLPLIERAQAWVAQHGAALDAHITVQLLAAQIVMRADIGDLNALADALLGALPRLQAAGNQAQHTLAYGQTTLAWVRIWQGQTMQAQPLFESGIVHFRHIDDRFGLAWALRGLSVALGDLGRDDDALRAITQCVALCRDMGDPLILATALGGMGECERAKGDLPSAIAHYAESGALLARAGDQRSLLLCTLNHTNACVQLGLRDESRSLLRELARLIGQSGELPRGHFRAYALLALAGSALLLHQDAASGAQLLGACISGLERQSVSLQPADRRAFDHIYTQLTQQLAADVLEQHWRAGATSAAAEDALLRAALSRAVGAL